MVEKCDDRVDEAEENVGHFGRFRLRVGRLRFEKNIVGCNLKIRNELSAFALLQVRKKTCSCLDFVFNLFENS